MTNGFGRGTVGRFGMRGGMGFGFRGSSPPWPYVGLGRGGLPRCGYFPSGITGPQSAAPYQQYTAPVSGNNPLEPQQSQEQEMDFLKSQSQAIKAKLEQIDARINELEKGS